MSGLNLPTDSLTTAKTSYLGHRKRHPKIAVSIQVPTPNPIRVAAPKQECYISPPKPGFIERLFGAKQEPPKPCPPQITKEYNKKIETELEIIYSGMDSKIEQLPAWQKFLIGRTRRKQLNTLLSQKEVRNNIKRLFLEASLKDATKNNITFPRKSIDQLITNPQISNAVYDEIRKYATNNKSKYEELQGALWNSDVEKHFKDFIQNGGFSVGSNSPH